MFTGIIDHCGTILSVKTTSEKQRLSLQSAYTDLVVGESIAVNGICLTVTECQRDLFYCDVSPETLKVTTAVDFKVQQKVNLERALQLSSRLGGHMVTGHVDQTARVSQKRIIDSFLALTIEGLTPDTEKFVIKKGSIAVNGVSLTINEVYEKSFEVMLIPHTLEITNLGLLEVGDTVNLEFDMMARLIVKQCQDYLKMRG